MAAERELRIKFIGDATGAQKAIRTVGNEADGMAGKMQQAGGLMAKALGAGALAAGAVGVAALKMGADFEASMAEVRTLLPQIGDEAFGALKQDVLDFASEMNIATSDAVPALYQAISAGVPPENVITFMETAAKAAHGGVTELETAVDGISSVVNAYGSETVSAAEASDIMFTAVRLGKCLTGDTRVLLADGRYERIDRLESGGKVVAFDGRGFVPLQAHWVNQGIKPSVRLRTRLGREIKTTWTHPYLTPDGWRSVKDLRTGDRIAVPTHLPYFGGKSVTEEESGLLGLWLAEGSSDLSSVRITSNAYGEQVRKWATAYGCEARNIERRTGAAATWSITSGPRGGRPVNPVQQMLRAHGLDGCTSATKHIPSDVYTWDRRSIANLLHWLFNGDGWLADLRVGGRSGFQVGFCSKSERLVRDVSHLLLRFGIVGYIRYRRSGDAWVWATNRHFEVARFVREIGIDRPAASEAILHVPQKERARWGVVEYDAVVQIEAGEPAPVYDLVVPDLHNFVAEDVIAHNTTFDELSTSLFNVNPTAAALGVSFEEVSAALATMTAQGVPTAVATTQLRQLFVEAGKEGSNLDKALRDLTGVGLTGFIEQGGTAQGAMQLLRESLGDEEFRNLFGSVEAMNAALQITGPNADKFGEALGEMQDSAGATDAAFETISETAQFKLDKAINTVKVEMTRLAAEALPFVVAAAEDAVEIFKQDLQPILEDVAQFVENDLIPVMERIGRVSLEMGQRIFDASKPIRDTLEFLSQHRATFAGVAAVIATALIPAIKAWTLAEYAKIKAMVAAGIAFVTANAPLIAIALAIGLLVAAIVLAIEHWGEIEGVMRQVGDYLSGAFSGAWEAIKGTIEGVVNAIKDTTLGVFQSVLDFLTDHWPEIAALISGPFFPIVALATDAFGIRSALVGALQAVIDFFTELPGNIVQAIGDLTGLLVDKGFDLIEGFFRGMGNAAAGIGGFIESAGEFVADTVKGFIEDAINFVIRKINSAIEKVNDIVGKIPGHQPDIPTIRELGGGGRTRGGSFASGTHVGGKPIAMAAGGIVTRPTLALVGERGPEAVIPLNGQSSVEPGVVIDARGAMFVDFDQFVRKLDLHVARLGSRGPITVRRGAG